MIQNKAVIMHNLLKIDRLFDKIFDIERNLNKKQFYEFNKLLIETNLGFILLLYINVYIHELSNFRVKLYG